MYFNFIKRLSKCFLKWTSHCVSPPAIFEISSSSASLPALGKGAVRSVQHWSGEDRGTALGPRLCSQPPWSSGSSSSGCASCSAQGSDWPLHAQGWVIAAASRQARVRGFGPRQFHLGVSRLGGEEWRSSGFLARASRVEGECVGPGCLTLGLCFTSYPLTRCCQLCTGVLTGYTWSGCRA